MATTTQTMTQTNIQDPPSLIEKTAAGQPSNNPGPPGGGGGQGTANPLQPPFGPSEGGNLGGGGGNPGGPPTGGNPGGNPTPHADKMAGQAPTIFEGDRCKSEAFIQEWNIYRGLN